MENLQQGLENLKGIYTLSKICGLSRKQLLSKLFNILGELNVLSYRAFGEGQNNLAYEIQDFIITIEEDITSLASDK